MGNTGPDDLDPVWDAAWAWVMRHHEEKYANEATTDALSRWLAAAPSHRQTYEKASRLWLMVGLVPPVSTVKIAD